MVDKKIKPVPTVIICFCMASKTHWYQGPLFAIAYRIFIIVYVMDSKERIIFSCMAQETLSIEFLADFFL